MTKVALHVRTKILPGHRIEVTAPGLPEGQSVSVFLVVEEEGTKQPLWDVLRGYAGGQLFTSAEQVDAYVQAERESWDK